MGQKVRGLAAAIAVTASVAAGAVTAVAQAAGQTVEAATCQVQVDTADPPCTLSATITDPSNISYQMNYTTGGAGLIFQTSWTLDCDGMTSQGSADPNTSSEGGPGFVEIPLNPADPVPTSCTVTVNITVPIGYIGLSQVATLNGYLYDDPRSAPSSTPSPSPSPSPSASSAPAPSSSAASGLVRGFHGMCLDDAGDKSAERTAIVIRSCLPTAAAEDWTYRSSELGIHKDMCVNAKGKGASGSKVILWACNGSANEIWVHEPDGEYKLKAHGYALCLTDPGFSTTSETQLVVLTCADKSDQRWTLP